MRHSASSEVRKAIESGEVEVVRSLSASEIDWFDRLNIRATASERAMNVVMNTFTNILATIHAEEDEFWQALTGDPEFKFREFGYKIGQYEGRVVLVKEKEDGGQG